MIEALEKVRLWNQGIDIEESALEQVRNVASLPITVGVRGMPDMHWGNGSAVGSVIATRGAVICAALGVDLGCFIGETKIPLLDGTQETLKNLTKRKEPFWVYSLNKDLQITAGKAIAKKTRTNAGLVKVVVSGGDEIICTPDHEFMLLDGSYCQAKDLQFNQSLMPLYRSWEARDGYESSSIGRGSSKLTHKRIYESLYGQVKRGMVIHHKNHNHFDNRPENLELMTPSEHSKYHRVNGHAFSAEQNQDEQFQAKRKAGIKQWMVKDGVGEELRKKGAAIMRPVVSDPVRYAKWREGVKDNGKRGAPTLTKFNTSPRQCPDCEDTLPNPAALVWHRRKEHNAPARNNHKVISVEPLKRKADVYCLQVDEHHNFALSAGVFVHNCGMSAVKTTIKASQLPDDLKTLRHTIERDIPVGSQSHRGRFRVTSPQLEALSLRLDEHMLVWEEFLNHVPKLRHKHRFYAVEQLSSLGGGNHFIEICLDEDENVWVMLHSGSRGIGNKIGNYFIELAKEKALREDRTLPDKELAWLDDGSPEFNLYVAAFSWAQDYAKLNREAMMETVLYQLRRIYPDMQIIDEVISCHHNYARLEEHFGEKVWITRKGAVSAREGELGIIPSAMGQPSFIVKGKGNPHSFCSCSHGAGRKMSRGQARKLFTSADLVLQTEGVECRKDGGVVDEIPGAYKDINQVIAAQSDLIEVVAKIKAILCIKG